MNNDNARLLEKNAELLLDLLTKIRNEYQESDDEYLNELFFSGLQKARDFYSNLVIIAKKEGGAK
ncbi:MAG: hypothetical protein PUF84_07915 [Ruminococcus bromii]|nr:hypothetical protein [Ruminococcus bromii]